ncbi:PLDc N-terminal domain-containing protein [Leifsonia sp. P73]|uniref:PLDc N-terminal domain-containing protein n=1 Tax=Leifsonia sp. P73 TaxID=3423959 RepID=UPI003DA2F72C
MFVMEFIFVGVGIAALIAIAAFVVVALVQIARRPLISPLLRVLWVVAVIAFPVLGSIAWFAFGDRTPPVVCPPRH